MKNTRIIIDTHCHIYPDKIALKASKNMSDFYSIRCNYDGTLSKLIELERAAGIDHTVVQSVATAPGQVSGINRFLAETVAASGGKFTALGALHPLSADIESDLRLIKELGLKGIKLHADIQQIAINDRRCYKIYEQCEGVLPILMHTGDSRYNYSNPDNMLPVLQDFKNLTVIGAHFGGWSCWEEAAKKLSRFDNFYVDTSSTLGFTNAEFVRKCINSYNIDRIMFGVDYPVWEPAVEIQALLSLNLSQLHYDKIFYQNAALVYGIKG